jgi:hypothetical protein
LGDHFHSGTDAHEAIHDDALARLEPGLDDAKSIDEASDRDRPVRERVVLFQDEHELPILIGPDRSILYQRRGVAFPCDEPDASKQSRCEGE